MGVLEPLTREQRMEAIWRQRTVKQTVLPFVPQIAEDLVDMDQVATVVFFFFLQRVVVNVCAWGLIVREYRNHASGPYQGATSFAHFRQLQNQSLISTLVLVSRGLTTCSGGKKAHHRVHLRLPRISSSVTQPEKFHGTIDQTLLGRPRRRSP